MICLKGSQTARRLTDERGLRASWPGDAGAAQETEPASAPEGRCGGMQNCCRPPGLWSLGVYVCTLCTSCRYLHGGIHPASVAVEANVIKTWGALWNWALVVEVVHSWLAHEHALVFVCFCRPGICCNDKGKSRRRLGCGPHCPFCVAEQGQRGGVRGGRPGQVTTDDQRRSPASG